MSMSDYPTFDNAVRQKVAGYEMQPEAYALENIFNHEAMQSRRRTRRRLFFLLFFFLSGTSLTTMAVVLNAKWLKKVETAAAADSEVARVSSELIATLANETELEALVPTEIASSPNPINFSAVGTLDMTVMEDDGSESVTKEEVVEAEADRLQSLRAEVLDMPISSMQVDAAPEPLPVWEVVTHERPKNEFHLGTHVMFNNTTLLNDNYFSKHEGYDLQSQTDFGAGYGVSVGYDFHRTIGIQTGVTIHSMEGQRYSGLIGGRHIDSEVLLRYIHIPVIVKLKHELPNTEIPIVLNALIGAQYGKVKAAELVVDNMFPGDDIVELFKENVKAALAGLDADFYLNPHMYVTLGLRGTLSGDISGTTLAEQNDGQPIKSLLVGVNFGLNFALTH